MCRSPLYKPDTKQESVIWQHLFYRFRDIEAVLEVPLTRTGQYYIWYCMGERERLSKARRELSALRRCGGIKARDLKHLAEKIGFKEVTRGKEPTWEHERPDLYPITIPGHRGDLARPTAISIIDRLLEDLDTIQGDDEEEQ
jgi:hypothetical protein